jgi:hypothetical protein
VEHDLITAIEKALGWQGPSPLGREFTLGSMDDPTLCPRLLTPTRLLDTILRRSVSPPQFRCFHGGEELHPDAYIANTVSRRGQSLPMARMDRLTRLIDTGCTIVLDTLDAFDPTMEIACQALQWWTHEAVQVNTYLTTNDAAGFNLHWDDHDVIIVQLGGEKAWQVRGLSRPAPMYRDAEHSTTPSEEIVWEGTLRTGDVMHIPRGYWHQATRTQQGSGYSLHATFGFVKRTGVDWLTWLADQSRQRELFRHDLDRADDGHGAHQLRDALTELAATATADVFLQVREQERPPRRRVGTAGAFGPITDVVCLTDFPPHVQASPTEIRVLTAGKEMTFAAKAEPALRPLLSGNPVNLSGLTTATGIDAGVLAAALIEHGVCAELTPELAAGYAGLCSGTA